MTLHIFQIFAFQILITFPIVYFSKKIGMMDLPNNRKLHQEPTPYTGGIIISITLLLMVFVTNYDNQYLNQILSFSILISMTGLIDDKYAVNPGTKIVLQFFPILLINNDFYLTNLGTYEQLGTLQLDLLIRFLQFFVVF